MDSDRLNIVLGRAHGKSHGGRNNNNNRKYDNNRYKIDRTHKDHANDFNDNDDYKYENSSRDEWLHDDRSEDYSRYSKHGKGKRNDYTKQYNQNRVFKKNRRGGNTTTSNMQYAVDQSQNIYDQSSRGGKSSGRGRAVHAMATGGIPVYKISLIQTKKENQDELLAKLFEKVGHQFVTKDLKTANDSTVFYVDESDIAAKISKCSRQIKKSDGMPLVIFSSKFMRPMSEMTPANVDKIKAVMSKRYNQSLKLLDLSSFADDAQLLEGDVHLSLCRSGTISALVDVIRDNIPELAALDLSHNRIFTLAPWQALTTAAPNLYALNLSHNNFREVNSMKSLKKLNVVEIKLVGNPFCNNYKNSTAKYTSDVQDVFPKITKLDDVAVTPATTFDIVDSAELPKSLPSYLPNIASSRMLLTFAQQYLLYYDSKEREALMNAYHDEAKFSLSVSFQNASAPRVKNDFMRYMHLSRNLKFNKDNNKRHTTLKCKRELILKTLQILPRTEHDLGSLTIDVGQASDKLINFQLSGVFKEVGPNISSNLRYFNRVFAVMPKGSGLVIINDSLMLTSVPQEMMKNTFTKRPTIFDSLTPVTVDSTGTATTGQQSVTSGQPSNGLSEQQCKEILARFIDTSGMNSDWSTMCLKQNGWDFERAGKSYLTLKESGKIPESAYIK